MPESAQHDAAATALNDADARLDALRRREALLVAGQELAGLVTLEWDVARDHIEWSRDPSFLLGPRPPGGYPLIREMVHPDDRASWLRERDRALLGEGPGPQEFRLLRTDGEIRWVAHVQRPSAVVDGRTARVTVALLDVTARRDAQDRATRLLQEAVENLEESFSLCDPEGRYIVTNRRFRENNAEIAEYIVPGGRYEDAVRAAIAKGLFVEAVGREEEWIQERLARRRNPRAGAVEQHRKGDRWVLLRETHLADGSVITLGLDITERKHAEERLQQFSAQLEKRVAERSAELADREAMLRLVTSNVPVGIGYYDRERRLRFANHFYARSMGFDDAAPLIGKRLEELFPAELLAEYGPYIDRAIRGEVVRYEAQRQLDTLRTGENILVPEKTPDGTVVGVFVAVVDISKRKQAELDLAARETLLRLVTENVPIKIIYWDATGRTLFANPQYARALGKASVADVIGKAIPELIPAENWAVHRPYFERALAGEGVRDEYTAPVGGEAVLDIHLVPDVAGDGRVRGVFATIVDISSLKTAQTDLRRSLSLLEATLESTADGLLVVSSDGRIASYNRRFVQLWNIPEPVLELRDDPSAIAFVLGQLVDPAAFTAKVEELYSHPDSESFDVLHFRDGRVFERYSRPQRVGDAIVGRVWSFRDVTARSRAEAAVRELNADLEARVAQRTEDLALANRELEAFSYTVSHDLRAPARAVAGFSQILLADHAAGPDEDGRRLLERMSAAGERMGEMIDGLLRLARVSRAELARVPLDLSAMARTVWEEVAATEPARRVEFRAAEGLRAHADPVLVRNVLQNLLGNAFKYTRPLARGSVEFCTMDADGKVAYCVRDNGVGFDMAYAGKLFGVFQRVHGYDEFEGTGVGLATAQRIVARHGGRIWADARPGKGATFCFTLG